MNMHKLITASVIVVVMVAVYLVGYKDGFLGKDSKLIPQAQATAGG